MRGVFQRGFVTPLRFGSVPVRVHWTVPLGVLLLALPTLAPGAWVGGLLVLLAHLGGRLLTARLRGLPTRAVRFHGFGGDGWQPGARPADRLAIAWGGLLGQLALAAAGALLRGADPSADGFLPSLAGAWVLPNLALAGLHLVLPFDPFAGEHVWSGGAGRGRGGGPMTSREIRQRNERAVAADAEAQLQATVREALRKAAEDAKKGRNRAD